MNPNNKTKKRNLILTRTLDPETASILINENFLVTVVKIQGKQVRLAFTELTGVNYKVDRLEVSHLHKGKKDVAE